MSDFWNSVWVYHPTTLMGWCSLLFMVTAALAIILALMEVKRPTIDWLVVIAAVILLIEATLSAYDGSAVGFWGRVLMASAIVFIPVRNIRSRAKKKNAASSEAR